MTNQHDQSERPLVLLITPAQWSDESGLEQMLSGLAQSADFIFDHVTVTPDNDTLAAQLTRADTVAVAYGAAADFVLSQPGATRFMALLHPTGRVEPRPDDFSATSVLITAGATDPAAPADLIGTLADRLDEAGAKTEVHWSRGGGQITPEEMARVRQWLGAARASLVDPRKLPIMKEDQGAKGRYVITAPGGVLAEMTYSRANESLIIIDHTEVPDAFRGTGTGMRLLERLLADARESGSKIIPLCPYAAAQFKRHPEWSDLIETRIKMKPSTRQSER